MPYELGLSFIALCLCVVLAVLVERRAARALGRAASFHLLRALVVFSTLAVPLALCRSGVLGLRSHLRSPSMAWRRRHHTGAAPRPAARVPRHHFIGRLHGHDEVVVLRPHERRATKKVHRDRRPNQTETHPIVQRRPRRRGRRRRNRPAQRLPREFEIRGRDAVHGVSDINLPDAVSPHKTDPKCLVAEEMWASYS